MSNYSNSNSRKFTFKRLLRIVALVLASAAVSAVIVFAFGGLKFENPLDKKLNPDNLLSYSDYDKTLMIEDTNYGVKIKWKDNGAIVINGKNNDNTLDDNEVRYYAFATKTLDPGTYTISGYEKANLSELGIYVKLPDQNDYIYADTKTDSFTLSEATTVEIGFYIGNGKYFFNKTLYPTLVSGDTAGEFYA